MREVVVSGSRLDLCVPELHDVDPLAAMWRDPKTMRYIGSGDVWSEDEVRARLERAIETHARTGMTFWTVLDRATSAVVGQGGLVPISFNGDEIELGYRLGREHWGRGYASEIASGSVGYGFGTLGLDRLVAVTYPENAASRRVLEKSGFVGLGMTDKYYGVPCMLYERVRGRAG